jgi:uncharacterized protein YkwD
MVSSKSSKQTSFLKGRTRWAGASWVLSALLASQSTVALRAADTPGTSKGCSSQPFAAGDAPAQSACLDTPQTEEAAQLEQRMWELINQEREDPSHLTETHGRARPLKWDEKLAEVARAHSRDMVEHGYVSHLSPDGSFSALRVSQAGIAYLCAGENIAKFRDVIRAQAAFMNEPPFGHNHRANILDPDFTHVGIGIVRGPDGMFYITQEFIQRP